jgi:hydrogenase-4 component B
MGAAPVTTPFALLVLLGYAVVALLVPRRHEDAVVNLGSVAQLVALGLAGRDAVLVLEGWPLDFSLGRLGPLAPRGLGLDALGAVFVVALVLVGAAVAIYAPAYIRRAGHRMSGRTQQALLALLEASILGVLTASDLVGLFIAWELMTLLATGLVLADGHRVEVKRAAMLYVIITHAGTLLALAGMLMLASGAPDLSFASVRAAVEHAGGPRPLALVLILVGFGTKAGVIPLHIWLPEAHPVAPSHVSAMLSGVILKVGVYGMLRAALDLVGLAPEWAGYALLGAGLTSAVLGVLYALMQHDLKRLLAFHSVENIGIILLGVGLGMVAAHAHLPRLALVAIAAGLFHVVNHAVFKGLLFLCAGSVHLGTHTRDLEHMGGLIARMPVTAWTFLVGALAISALPPLNGFASEWLILQGFLGLSHAPGPLLRSASPLFAAGLALTGALAAACFVKAFAVAFLALPRSPHAEHAVEAPPAARAAQLFLAALCAVLGLGAPWVVTILARALGADWARFGTTLGGDGLAQVQPITLAAAGILLVGGAWLFLGRRAARPAPTWACGQGTIEGRTTYTASAFANPIKRIFANLYRFERETVPIEGVAPYFVKRSRTHGDIAPLFERYLYQPTVRLYQRASEKMAPWTVPTVNRGLFLLALVTALLLWWAS